MVRWRARRRGVLTTAALVAGLAVAAVLVLLLLGSVGSGGPAGGGDTTAAVAPGDAEPLVIGAPDGGAPAPGASASSPAPSAPSSKATIAPPIPGDPDPAPPVDTDERAVVRTARLALTVADLPAVSATVRDAATSVGGFVAAEHTVTDAARSWFTLRVPSARLDEVMTRLAATGTVTERFGQAEDVTAQMVDLQSRLATQRASVARVRALLERATTVGEVVAVESELTTREAELESLQRRLAVTSGRVALSTLTVALTPPAVVSPVQAGVGFVAGLSAGWRAFLAAGAGVLTALGAMLPFLVSAGVLIGVAVLGRRALRRHRAASSALTAVAGGTGSGGRD